MKPDSGQVLIDGKDVTRMDEKELSALRLKFGMLFQGAALFDSMNVYENVGFNLIEHTNCQQGRDRKGSERIAGAGRVERA